MQNVVLISCTSKKRGYKCKAKELYDASSLFAASYSYSKMKNCKVYILSAKYGLLDENDIVEPYNETLPEKTPKEIAEWAYFLTVTTSFCTGQNILVDGGESINYNFVWKKD